MDLLDKRYEMNDILNDTEKFSIMARVFHNQYKGYEKFAKMINVGRSTVHNWEQRKTKTINGKAKSQICDIFNLQFTIWTDKFEDEINFENSLYDYQKVNEPITPNDEEIITRKIVGEVKALSKNEVALLDELAQHKTINISLIELTHMTPMFLFEYAHLLKNKKQIREALSVIQLIEKIPGTYKYTHYNKLQHLKAILLSDETFKKWDEAIHILRLLYSSSHYHLQEPEVITLMASNYKRKALNDTNGWVNANTIDKDLLFKSFSLYHDAYNIKDIQSRYYDAINIAYLNNIIDSIEPDFTDKLAIKELYSELLQAWTPSPSNWWEVSSKAEFLVLIDKLDLSLSEISFFLESNNVEPFEIESTLRQLEMYLHFVNDKNAQVFYTYLQESWEALNIKP